MKKRSFDKIYKRIEKQIQGKQKKIKHKKKEIVYKQIKEIKERKRRRILDRIEDKIPSTFFRG